MKIAICMFGHTGGYGNRENVSSTFSPNISFKNIKERYLTIIQTYLFILGVKILKMKL